MTLVKSPAPASSDSELAAQLAKLWPHREHEAPAAAAILCRVGLHPWRRLDLATLAPDSDIRYCFWCSKIKVNGVVYDA
jgi:hypothetical protein